MVDIQTALLILAARPLWIPLASVLSYRYRNMRPASELAACEPDRELNLSFDDLYLRQGVLFVNVINPSRVCNNLKVYNELDTSQKSFFVEVDPPEGGIWEKFTPMDFSDFPNESDRTRRSFHKGGSRLGSYELCYNPEHAEHKNIKESDQTSTAQYRFKLTVPELCLLDLENEWGNIFSEDDRKNPVRQATVFKDTVDKYTDTKHAVDV